MLNKIGKIKSINYQGLIEELRPLDRDARLKKYWQDSLFNRSKLNLFGEEHPRGWDKLLIPDGNCYSSKPQNEVLIEASISEIDKIKRAENHNKLFNKEFEITYLDDEYVAFLYSASCGTIIPRKFVEIEFAKNYDELTPTQINNLLSGGADVSSNTSLAEYNNKSKKEISISLEKQKKELDDAKEKASAELQAFRDEMHKKEMELREAQEKMLAELNSKVSEMQDQIFLLENNIFALRSYFGDTFDLTQVMKGKNAPESTPLVIYQKFRFMDEDLARLSANSSFSVEKTNIISMFENYGDVFVKDFCPAEKCITFFRASKTGVTYDYEPNENCVKEFEYYHGKQVGMLLRNGENLWLAFIDEEITLKDNLFISQNTSDEEVIKIEGDEKPSVRDKIFRPVFARKHIFLIMNAILRLTSIYPELKNQSVNNNPNIIFSSADGQIESYKYPTFKDFFRKSVPEGIEHKVGDFIFVDEYHAGNSFDSWVGYSHRSVGYRNTTRDANIEKGISRINLINEEDDGWLCRKKGDRAWTQTWRKPDEGTFDEIEKKSHTEYYISCKRNVWWDDTNRHNNANVRIYSDEFMSIMWLNSNYVQQWIDAKQVPDKNYTYYIKMMKELRDYLRQREKNEFLLINEYNKFEDTPENRDRLLEWRIKNKVRFFTEYQAKRFVKEIKV